MTIHPALDPHGLWNPGFSDGRTHFHLSMATSTSGETARSQMPKARETGRWQVYGGYPPEGPQTMELNVPYHIYRYLLTCPRHSLSRLTPLSCCDAPTGEFAKMTDHQGSPGERTTGGLAGHHNEPSVVGSPFLTQHRKEVLCKILRDLQPQLHTHQTIEGIEILPPCTTAGHIICHIPLWG